MHKSIQSVMLTDFFIDCLALWAALYPVGRVKPLRIALAAAMGALLTGIAAAIGLTGNTLTLLALAAAPLLTLTAAGIRVPGVVASSAVLLTLTCAFISLAARVSGLGMTTAALAAAVTSWAAARAYIFRRDRIETWETGVTITYSGLSAEVSALIDTGNRLKEPLSALPVMIVEHRALIHLLPGSFDPFDPASTLPRGWRLAAYGGLGGSGCIGCFMPDRLTAANGRSIFGVWVGVFGGELPGDHAALAPPGLIHATQTKWRR